MAAAEHDGSDQAQLHDAATQAEKISQSDDRPWAPSVSRGTTKPAKTAAKSG